MLSSAALKSSDMSASCGREEVSLTPSSLLPLRMRERFGPCVVVGAAGDSKSTFELWEEELLPLAGSIIDLDRSRVCLDWRNFGNLEMFAGVEEVVDELRDLEDIRIERANKREEEWKVETSKVVDGSRRRRCRCCGRWATFEMYCSLGKAWQVKAQSPTIAHSNQNLVHKKTTILRHFHFFFSCKVKAVLLQVKS